jgi:uncharacterized protein (TIGR03067 family)
MRGIRLFLIHLAVTLTLADRVCLAAVPPKKAASTPPATTTWAEPTPANIEFFEREVRPILATACYSCHSERAKKSKGDLVLDTWEGVSRGGSSGPVIIPGQPDKSPLITGARWIDPNFKMPPKEKLTDQTLIVIERWVKMGAPYPRTAGVVSAPSNSGPQGSSAADLSSAKSKWQFQPVKDAPSPKPNSAVYEAFSSHPIDRLLAQKWEANGLLPPPLADKRTLLRRATFDLTGLPPSAQEMQDFLEDKAPDAFTKVINRLLAAPGYGERWGRHWMDVVRYADTAGDGGDYPIPEARLYRDYIIHAFNTDKPYPRFIREQIAGDLLPFKSDEERKLNLVATGYLAMSRRFGAVPDIFLTMDDTVDNLGRGLLGLTISCARCHNHKFDPISMQDYYGLFAFFSSIVYPSPGSELSKRQKDFVPIFPKAVADKIMAPYLPKLTEFDERQEALKKIKENFRTTPGSPEFKKVLKDISALEKERMEYEETLPKLNYAYAVSEGSAHDEQIRIRGEPYNLGEPVARHFPALLGGQTLTPEQAKTSGRVALADWIVDPKNPLTLRVFVNRVWGWHFGRPLMETPNDWGKQSKPTVFPELIDYLVTTLVRSGYSLKALHRFIMVSKAYQMSAEEARPNADRDGANVFLWHFLRQRHDGESIRDAILSVSGDLELKPPVNHPFPPKEKWDFTQHEPFSAVYDTPHRSVYQMQQRIKKHPFFELFDGADTNACTGMRAASTTPLQSLFLMNNSWVRDQSFKTADRILQVSGTPEKRIPAAYLLALNRRPTDEETAEANDFLKRFSEKLKLPQRDGAHGQQATKTATDDLTGLQGDWICVMEEAQGQILSEDKLSKMDKRMNVDKDLMSIKRTSGGKFGAYEGKFKLDSAASPKTFDFSGTAPDGKQVELKGIYEFGGDDLKLIYAINGGRRPTEFKTTKGPPCVYVQFKRDANAPANSATKIPAESTPSTVAKINKPPKNNKPQKPISGGKRPQLDSSNVEADSPSSPSKSLNDAEASKAALAAFVRTLFASNEFLFIE